MPIIGAFFSNYESFWWERVSRLRCCWSQFSSGSENSSHIISQSRLPAISYQTKILIVEKIQFSSHPFKLFLWFPTKAYFNNFNDLTLQTDMECMLWIFLHFFKSSYNSNAYANKFVGARWLWPDKSSSINSIFI